MAEHPNVARVRRGYEIRGESIEFSQSARAEIENLFHPGLVYHGQGASRFGQDFVGRDQFFAVERQLSGTMRQVVRQVFADDVHAVVIAEVHAQHDGKETVWTEAEIFHFGPDGRITDTWGIPTDQAVVDDYWSSVISASAQ
jgi:hypothetical protein